jgi:hypothetical protein
MGGRPDSQGYYNVPQTGYYVCYANLRIDSHTSSYYLRTVISINSKLDADSSLSHIGGDRESTNYRSARLSGTIWLKQKDKVSIYVYSQADNSWYVQGESGFGCHMFASYSCTPCPSSTVGTSLEKGCKCKTRLVGKITGVSGKNGGYKGECTDPKIPCGDDYGFSTEMRHNQGANIHWTEIRYWNKPKKNSHVQHWRVHPRRPFFQS